MRVGAQFRHKLCSVCFMHQAIHLTFRVVEVSEQSCPLVAGTHTIRLLALPKDICTEGALLYYAQFLMRGSCAIRAGHHTCLTANTLILVYEHNAVIALV